MSISNQPAGQRETAQDRRVRCLELRKLGNSYRTIGAALSISEAQAHRDVHAALAALAEQERGLAEEYRALELARLDIALTALFPRLKSGDVGAVNAWVKVSESRRKLLGLDLAQPIAPAGDTNIIVAVLAALADYPDARVRVAALLAAPEVEVIDAGDSTD